MLVALRDQIRRAPSGSWRAGQAVRVRRAPAGGSWVPGGINEEDLARFGVSFGR